MTSPQQRTRENLTERGYLVGSVERRKKFPDRKKGPCRACGHQPMIEISSDLWEIFDIVALKPDRMENGVMHRDYAPLVFVQTTSRANHSTRRNKIMGSMEAKLVLLSGARILLQSWALNDKNRWEVKDEWITLKDFESAYHYPETVAELMEIRRKEKKPDLPKGSTLPLVASES